MLIERSYESTIEFIKDIKAKYDSVGGVFHMLVTELLTFIFRKKYSDVSKDIRK